MIPWASIIAAVVGAVVFTVKVDVNLFAMRFFRDVARSKARKRLYGNNHALMPILLGKEEPISIDHDAESTTTMTKEELAEYRGEDGSPLYLAIKGRIYDVSANEHFYGEDGKYHLFTGVDATRAFATGCLKDECVSSSMEGLTSEEMKQVENWIELYETHDQYTFIGTLIDVDPVDAILEKEEDEGLEVGEES